MGLAHPEQNFDTDAMLRNNMNFNWHYIILNTIECKRYFIYIYHVLQISLVPSIRPLHRTPANGCGPPLSIAPPALDVYLLKLLCGARAAF